VTPAERRRLVRDGNVAALVPDVLVSAPMQPRSLGAQGQQAGAPAAGDQPACPSDPTHPLVEPEGLSLIKADQVTGVDGSGVKVGLLADSIDVDNPDFVRPDGLHVIVDYRDFTGEGTQTPTYDFEAFGDASSIAAQGTTVHDLSTFVSPAHPLPTGCNVIFRGVAPGASLAAMKVFGNSRTPLSTILEGLDWAVAVDHVDVLNESLGIDAIPDTGQNLLVQFNRQAVAAGVTVVVSSGDEGAGNMIDSPASDPSAIAVGASTQLRTLAETGFAGGDLFGKGWLNDNISYASSSGFTENGRTLDLVAPGDTGLETCTPDPLYLNCQNLGTGLSDVAYFSGTSESAPIVAGVAALVIEAYRNTHGGTSPTPALVRQILLSTADDLGYPSSEQGAGLVDAAAAVHAAETIDYGYGAPPWADPAGSAGSAPNAPVFLASPGQLDLVATAGQGSVGQVTVRNPSTVSERIAAGVRSLAVPFADQQGQVTLDPATDPTFVDDLGTAQSYHEVTFNVPAGVDLLGASEVQAGDGLPVDMTLFDPLGHLANYAYGAGPTNYSHAEVADPTPGTWTAVFYTPQSGGFNGNVLYDFTFSRFTSLAAVWPTSLVIPPGGQGTLVVNLPPSATPGDRGDDLVLSNGLGQQSVVPVVVRGLVPLNGGRGTFTGTVTGGDGYSGIGSRDTFQFNVPPGTPAIGVIVSLANAPGTQLYGYLVGPDGETSAEGVTVDDGSGNQVMQLHHLAPLPGRWTFEQYANDPVGGTSIAPTFTGSVSLTPVPVTATAVPEGFRSQIPVGGSQTASVTVTNPGSSPITVFLDARRHTLTQYPLVPLNHATVTLPRTRSAPAFLVPTQTTTLQAAVQATAPVEFDWGFYDPSLLGTGSGDSASSTFSASEVAPVEWEIDPALVGPLAGPMVATATAGMIATTRTFDPSVTSSTGDAELATVDRDAPATTPVTIPPGGHATLTASFSPTAADGTSVTGDLYVVDDVEAGPTFNELAEIPYSFQVRRVSPKTK
jgi:subtilisin family serine protease